MNVASSLFLLFGVGVAALYNLSARLWWRQGVLLIANLGFLGFVSTSVVAWGPYVAFLLWGYLSYRLILNQPSRWLLPSIVSLLLIFFWLKKYSFLPENSFLDMPYVTLGMSYVLFRILQLLVDANDGLIDGKVGPVTFINYTLNFTSIISGPIQRFQDYAEDQLNETVRPRLDLFDVATAAERVIVGYFKIAVLGVAFQSLQTHELSSLSLASGFTFAEKVQSGVLICVAYTLYLYCNFSGYTDIVIGIAKGFRLKLPENFDRPFSATNFLDFWGRWHMSLSGWLKTFVYSPLLRALMMRVSAANMTPYLGALAYFVTFFIIGLWHGRTSVFAVYGLLLGLGVSVNKLYQVKMAQSLGKKRYRALCGNWLYSTISRGVTFAYFTMSLVWFWSNWSQMADMLNALGAGALGMSWIAIVVCAAIVLAAVEWLRDLSMRWHWGGQPVVQSRYVRVVWATLLCLITVAFTQLLSMPAPDVVYKAF